MMHHSHTPAIDWDARYARADLAAMVGVSEDVISFWSRNGLVRHSEGGEGKGSHRRFAPPQVAIAGILAAVRTQFGPNTTILQSLAELLQDSIALFEQSKVSVASWQTVASLSTALHLFRTGETVMVWRDPSDNEELTGDQDEFRRPADSEADLVGELLFHLDHDSPQSVIREAAKFPPHRGLQADIAVTLMSPLLYPSYQGEVCWLAAHSDNGWKLLSSSNGYADFQNMGDSAQFGCAMFIPVDGIVRKVLGIKSGQEYMDARRAARHQEKAA